jgi:hypothetical protein
MDRLTDSFRKRAVAAAILLVLSACASAPTPFVSQIGPTDIVRQNALDSFETALGKDDLPSLQSFRDRIASATNRQDLMAAWSATPGLAARGNAFLPDHVFSMAIAEARWPRDRPPSDFEASFVSGVRQAVDAFIKELQ